MLLARYAAAAVAGFAVLLLVMLLVRPIIFSMAPARTDANYAVAAVADVSGRPAVRDVLLADPHGLRGERPQGIHAAIRVVVSSLPGGAAAVVNAYSTANPCEVEVVGDRLRDCAGAEWTLRGVASRSGQPGLQVFPTEVRQGAVIADFTRPLLAR